MDVSMQMTTVSALNTKIGSLLEATFVHVMVEGEVAQVTYHRSGHVYFSIKDDKSTLSCVMWRSTAARMKFRLEPGEHIVIEGSISVYVPRGAYQLIATHIEPYGKGTLAVAFEQLKTELKAKGYFDADRKKPLPKFPAHIALVTAAGGAALQDMLTVAEKRWPAVAITVIDVLVQGEAAAGEIARGIAYADTLNVDLIIAGRGGGSLEDLWAFNERIVAEAIYEATTPVVSAVGHEVDTLISDFVADLRAPTPSAAMEMVLPDRNELRIQLDELTDRMERHITHKLQASQERIDHMRTLLAQRSPMNRLIQLSDQFTHLQEEYQRTITYRIEQSERPIAPLIEQYQDTITFLLRQKEGQIQNLSNRIELYDPAKRSREGYGEILQDGKRVALAQIEVGEEFEVVSERVKMRAVGVEKVNV